MSTDLNILEAAPPDSKAARLAKLLPAIEAALKKGYSHRVIFDHVIKTEGLELSFEYYKITLHRLRKKETALKEKSAKPAPLSAPPRQLPGPAQRPPISPPALPSGAPGEKFKYDVHESIDDFFS